MRLLQKFEDSLTSLYRKFKCLWNLSVDELPSVNPGASPRPFVVYSGDLYYWDGTQYSTVSAGGVPLHTHLGVDITDLTTYLNTTQINAENYADGLFQTVVGTPIPAVAFDTIAEIAAYLENDQPAMAALTTAMGNRLRFDVNNQGLLLTEKTNAKTNLGIQNIDNTSDADKPISTAVATALSGKSDTGHTHDDRYFTEAEITALLDAFVPSPPAWEGRWVPVNGMTTMTSIGLSMVLSSGTATAATLGNSTAQAKYPRIEYIQTTNVGAPYAVTYRTSGTSTMNTLSTFYFKQYWGLCIVPVSSTDSCAFGLQTTSAAPTGVSPMSINTLRIAMGFESGDTNFQLFYRDASSVNQKIDLGASFPVSTADRADFYCVEFYNTAGATSTITYKITNLSNNAVATGSVVIPSGSNFLNPFGFHGVPTGGSYTGLGFALGSMYMRCPF